MTPPVEDKLLTMKEKLKKIARQKSVGQKNSLASNMFSNGVLDLNLFRTSNKEVTVRSALLDHGKCLSPSDISSYKFKSRLLMSCKEVQSVKILLSPRFADVPYPVVMEPNLITEYFSF
jgi:hypothetical protein